MLKTKIKASRITNLTDARYFAAWGVEHIGFNLEEGTPNCVDDMTANAIMGWLEGPAYMGEIGSFPDVGKVVRQVSELKLYGVQVGAMCPRETIRELHRSEVPVFKEIVWNEHSDWGQIQEEYETLSPWVACFVLDFSKNQMGVSEHEASLRGICQIHPTLLDLPMNGQNAEDWLNRLQPFGFAIKGGEEEKVGYKSFDELDGIFEALEIFV